MNSRNDYNDLTSVAEFNSQKMKKNIYLEKKLKSGFYLITISSIEGANGRDKYFLKVENDD